MNILHITTHLGGGVGKAGDLLMKSLLANLRAQMFPLLMEDLVILPARFGSWGRPDQRFS